MDVGKIGRFIATLRKEHNLTQEQLAEKLFVSDRAVSKWERGINLPDASIMLELCAILGISVNELLSGQLIAKENYMKETEELLLELKKENENNSRRLLMIEVWAGILICIGAFALVFASALATEILAWRIALISLAAVIFIIFIVIAILIEQKAGYYECQACKHKYIPTYGQVFFAMHYGRRRYMKCPVCHKRTWQKKTISK